MCSNACAKNMKNKKYAIRYTPLSFEDLNEIDSYISDTLCNPDAALRLLDKMEKSIGQLKEFPHIGSAVEDAYLASKGYRKLVVENYLVFYLINELTSEVIVMRVLYGAREYQNLL